MNGITFNSKHSYTDFNLIMNSKKISIPSKKKIKESVPGMNSVYDFSTVASNGEIIYNQRSIVVKFTLISTSKAKLHTEITKVVTWLQDVGQNQLIFDDLKDYYFMAELEDSIEIIESNSIAEITIKFIAEPFKIGISLEGSSKEWDNFNFEEDILQDSEFDVVNTAAVSIYNVGRLVMPTINCSAPMSIIYNSKTYNFTTGDNKTYGFKFINGTNNIIINGTGKIKFGFRKVSL